MDESIISFLLKIGLFASIFYIIWLIRLAKSYYIWNKEYKYESHFKDFYLFEIYDGLDTFIKSFTILSVLGIITLTILILVL